MFDQLTRFISQYQQAEASWGRRAAAPADVRPKPLAA